MGWSTNPSHYPEYACDAPEGYEDADADFFKNLVPTSIDCTHENYIEADCFNPERCNVCGIVREGSTALGHDIVTDEAVESTCTETGLTEGEHCSRCDEATVEQETVGALGHSWVDATTEAPKTCEDCGETEGEKLPAPTPDPDTSTRTVTTSARQAVGIDFGMQ